MTLACLSRDARRRLRAGVAAFVRCDRGNDLVEYALLTAFIGVVSIAAWSAIESALGASYAARDSGTQDLWASPDPKGTP